MSNPGYVNDAAVAQLAARHAAGVEGVHGLVRPRFARPGFPVRMRPGQVEVHLIVSSGYRVIDVAEAVQVEVSAALRLEAGLDTVVSIRVADVDGGDLL